MSRTQVQGIEFFPLDVDFFSDKKIKILKARYGADGITVFLYVLCQIYREGYYTKVDDDFKFMISEDLNMSPDKVEQIMLFLFERSMFNEQLLKSDDVITSAGIQERWQKAVAARAAKTPIEVSDYWLLKESETRPFIKVTHFQNCSEKNEDNSKKKDLNSENYKQSKVKESKGKESKGKESIARMREVTPLENFLQRWKINSNAIGNYSGGKLSSIDWEKLSKKIEQSKNFLQKQKALSFFIQHYEKIMDGAYDDFTKSTDPIKARIEAEREEKEAEWDRMMEEEENGGS